MCLTMHTFLCVMINFCTKKNTTFPKLFTDWHLRLMSNKLIQFLICSMYYGNVFMSFVSTVNSASLNTIHAPYVTVLLQNFIH